MQGAYMEYSTVFEEPSFCVQNASLMTRFLHRRSSLSGSGHPQSLERDRSPRSVEWARSPPVLFHAFGDGAAM